MAFDLVSAYAESFTPFYVTGDSGSPPTLVESPQQITLRFSPGVVIDGSAASLGSISMRRSGRGGDAFGAAGTFTDVPVEFGSILVDDAPNQNQIVLRFKETLVDDSYQIIVGAGLLSNARGSVNPTTIDLRLQLGSFVTAVVPQPVSRVAGALSQSRDSIDVYFNTDEQLLVSSVTNTAAYRVIEVDGAGNDTGTAIVPATVSFVAATGRASLRFATNLPDGKLYRLEIGGLPVTTLLPQPETTDENAIFSDAQNLGTLGRTGAGASAPTLSTVTGAIDTRQRVKTPAGSVGFPSQPGSVDEPGHRDTTVDSGAHGLPFANVDPATGITVIEYNFKPDYGFDPQGNPLQNVITETQKQRAREVFELYSLVAGVRFVETPSKGICIATGDLRALDPNTSVTGVAGLGGGNSVVLNSTIDWGASEYGGYWFNVAMHEIGHALGLDHSYDVPSIMGGALPGEAVFPGDYDSVHLRQLYQPNGSDIDVYQFELSEAGTFSAETVIARPGQKIASKLDSVLSLYKQEIVNGKTVRTLVARNDDYYGRDSFIGLSLGSGTYFLAVSNTGNTAFNPEVPDSGNDGRSDGTYEARLRFTPASAVGTTVFDASGTPFDGDRDGAGGGAYAFWFRTAAVADTVFVDKLAVGSGSGSLSAPYSTIKAAIAAIGSKTLLRIVGNDQNKPYLIGTTLANAPLPDGSTFVVPKGVTAMIDAGAILKLRAAIVDVGSSSSLTGASRAGAALQVLGIPGKTVVFTSYHDDTIGGDSDNVGPQPAGGQWGGIVFREDSDAASKKAFVNTISQASISYGGGQVFVNSQLASFAPIEIESTRPTVTFSSVTRSSGAALAATPDSFEDSFGRIGPEIRGNRLIDNSINGLFIKIDTGFGRPLERLSVPARLRSTDVVYVLQENLVIDGGAGGYLEAGGIVFARQSGRLAIDPGVVVKLQGARIELERGVSQLIAEGSPGQQVIFTAFGDNRFGAGGTFDTNGNLPNKFDAYGAAIGTLTVGDWGGIIANAGTKASIDQAYLAFGGGTTPIEGTFDSFNVIEVHQADVRLANSRLENNAAGKAVSSRDGRGTNEAATVFVRGAQPIVVGNDFRANAGAVVSINANSFADVERPDAGRSTGAIERFAGYDDNVGPLVRSNRMSYGGTGLATAGLTVRGEEITVESVWDDTDITHVVTSEIIVKNFHTATGLRLVSKPNESLVVKLLGASAGFTASGYGLDIQDRIGGTVQIVGQPGYPVILTSLRDDSVGAGLDPLGNIVKDTNTDGTDTSATANDWRSLKFMPYSNDRNVAIAIESETAYTGGIGRNDTVFDAQPLGVLAANVATGTNTAESAQEKSGDSNRRLGFEVHGFISADTPSDIDTYQFTGYAGSEVWIDLDKTSSALDTMVELLDASGNALARSADSALEGGIVKDELQIDPGLSLTAVYTLDHGGAVAASLTGVIWDLSGPSPVVIQTFTCDASGVLAFRNVLNPAVSGSFNPATGDVAVTYATEIPTEVHFQYRYAEGPLSPATVGMAQALGKNAWQGGDFYSQNSRDAGMRVVLPGPAGAASSYFVRVRSQPRCDATTTTADYETALTDPNKVATGASSGRYELRLRLRQRDEKPGSTVRYADIRYPATGIDVQGLPRNSLLASETGENSTDDNDAFGTAQYVGNLLQSDRNTIGIAGRISSATDVDWYTFSLNYEQIQAIPGVNASGQTFATMFDIDYADGFRGDLTISVFDDKGTLIYVGRDSNVADDQPGTGQGNDFDDLSRGSVGKLDPFIGSVTLPAGIPTNAGNFTAGGQLAAATTAQKSQQQRYYVAISSNQRLPAPLNANFISGTTNVLARLEPIDSVRRVAEDHIGFIGYKSGKNGSAVPVDPMMAKPLIDVLKLSAHATAFTLGDVTLFASSATGLATYNGITGVKATTLPNVISGMDVGDLDMRRDGRLYAYAGVTSSTTTAGRLLELNPSTGATLSSDDDGIEDPNETTPLNFQTKSDDVTALAFKRTAVGTFGELWFAVTDGTSGSKLYRAADGGSATTAADATADQTEATSSTLGFRGAIKLTSGNPPIVTGLQFVDEVGGKLLGVTRDGRFIEITPGTKEVTTPADTDPTIAAAVLLTDFKTQLPAGATGFEALASAPLNLQGGRFAGTLFALTGTGQLCVIDPQTNNLVDVPEWGGFFSPSMGTGLTGIAFSPLDFNLWHPTTARGTDAGHGVPVSADGPRDISATVNVTDGAGNTRKQTQGAGGGSMYFGLEDYVDSGITPYLNYDATRSQYGLSANPFHQDLTATAAIGGTAGSKFGNYNLPGGAFGSLTTNPFSLSGYQYADKPTLYFNYFLETEQASGKTNEMRDSARVLVSIDGGLTWELLATNNSSLSTPDTTDAELPHFASASSKISTLSNQQVQQLFDGISTWRQARIDLGIYAGSPSVQLRFDFSTAGEMDAKSLWATSRTSQKVTDGSLLTLDSVTDLKVGYMVAGNAIPSGTTVTAIDAAANTVTLSRRVTLAATTLLSFTARSSTSHAVQTVVPLNDVSDLQVGYAASGTGVPPGTTVAAVDSVAKTVTLSSAVPLTTGMNLTFRYQLSTSHIVQADVTNSMVVPLDAVGDVAIGASVFGEGIPAQTTVISVGPGSSVTLSNKVKITALKALSFPSSSHSVLSDVANDVLVQLDSVAGLQTGYAVTGNGIPPGTTIVAVDGDTATITLSSPATLSASIGLAFQWTTVRSVPNAPLTTSIVSIDSSADVQVGDSVTGNGVAADTTVTAVDPTANTVTLSKPLLGVLPSSLTFSHIDRWLNDITGKAGTTGKFDSPERGQNNDFEGFYIDDILVGFAERGEMVTGAAAAQTAFFDINTPKSKEVPEQTLLSEYQLEIRRGTDYVAEDQIQQVFDTNDQLVESNSRALGIGPTQGDANLDRQQGVFLIENNVVSHAGGYGIKVDAAARDGESNMPHPGVARNLPVLNANRLVPGVVIVNNVISTSGISGILFSGDATPGSIPPAVTPFGIIMNNTVYGGTAATGIGLEITDNAGPTVLNNVFASLKTGVSVDASSAANTVAATSAFHNTTTAVVGILQSQGITLLQSPFVSAIRGNFYPSPLAAVIDSALNALQDRSTFVAVNSGVGIGPFPILAPDRDLFGQLRSDDPSQAGLPGLGGSVFKDRGAIDRVDFIQPYARLAVPLDDGSEDLAAAAPNVVILSGDTTSQTRFELQLDDLGIGIDKSTVVPEAFTLTLQGVILVEGKDYIFRYLETSNRVVLESASVFRPGSYVLTAHSREEKPSQTGLLIDYANNTLLPNNPDGTTTFSIILMSTPDIPIGVTGTTSSFTVNLTWMAPAFDGGASITDYLIQYSSNAGATWTTYPDGTSAALAATVTELSNDTEYLFRVAAVNSEGTGDFSAPSSTLTPGVIVTAPAAPSGLTGVAANAQVSLTWVAPVSNGGAAITDYLIQFSPDSGTTWTAFVHAPSASTSQTITGLTNGVGYVFRVAAVNSAGTGGFSSVTSTLTPQSPFAPPGAPTGVAGYRGNGQVILSWTAPTSNGGPAVTDYAIEYRPATGLTWIPFNDGVSATTSSAVTGLTNGTGYVFRVAAVNIGGIGAYSTPTTTITPSAIATVPAPPTAVTGTATDAAVLLSWTAPVTTGGATISDYAVQYSSNGGATWLNANDGLSAATTAWVRGLTNGTNYVFRVAAVNSVGTGSFSSRSAAVMPVVQVVFNVASNTVNSDVTTRVGAVQLVKRGAGSLVLTKSNSHVGGTVLEAGILTIQNASALGSGPLTVRAGATLVIDLLDTAIPVSSLTVDAGGRIDFGYGRMTIPYDASSWSAVRDLLIQGHAANWSVSKGLGTSKAATLPGSSLGYVLDGSGGVTFGFAATGDANVDGCVDVLDVASILGPARFNTGDAATWSEGDFNYDGVVDILDLAGFLSTKLVDAGRYVPSEPPQGKAYDDGLSANDIAFLAFGLDSAVTDSDAKKNKRRFASA